VDDWRSVEKLRERAQRMLRTGIDPFANGWRWPTPRML